MTMGAILRAVAIYATVSMLLTSVFVGIIGLLLALSGDVNVRLFVGLWGASYPFMTILVWSQCAMRKHPLTFARQQRSPASQAPTVRPSQERQVSPLPHDFVNDQPAGSQRASITLVPLPDRDQSPVDLSDE